MEKESICYDCINYMKTTTQGAVRKKCTLDFEGDLDRVVDCSHFKPKKVEDKEHLGKASDIKDKETLKRKGQTIEEQGEVNPDMGGQN